MRMQRPPDPRISNPGVRAQGAAERSKRGSAERLGGDDDGGEQDHADLAKDGEADRAAT